MDDELLVLADALLTRGDPRGELILVQTGRAARPYSRAVATRERALLRAHSGTWLGPLAPIATVVWRSGFAAKLTVDLRGALPGSLDFAAVDPRHLASLEVVSRDLSARDVEAITAFVRACPALTSLVLWLGRGDLCETDLAPLLDALPPSVERLAVRDSTFTSAIVTLIQRRAPKLAIVDLAWGRLTPAEEERARDAFGDRLVLGVQDDEVRAVERRARCEAGFAAVLAEDARYGDFDSEMASNPYAPWRVARSLLAHADLTPVLVAELGGPRDHWAFFALEAIGAEAGPAAAEAIAARGPSTAFWAVDELRARRLGIHRQKDPPAGQSGSLRSLIAQSMLEHQPRRYLALMEELLSSDSVDVLSFALGAGGYDDRSMLDELSRARSPDFPRALVRELLTHPAPPVRQKAAWHLAELQHPEDALHILESIAASGQRHVGDAPILLGSHPESERLLPCVDLSGAYEIVRRRRCAGLMTDASLLEERLSFALSARPSIDERVWRRELEAAARIAGELRIVALAPALARATGPVLDYQLNGWIAEALRSLGEAGPKAVKAARATMRKKVDADRKARLTSLLEELTRPPPRRYTQTRADELFAAGTWYDVNFEGAFDYYARILLADPTNAHAAERCAFIERSYGAWISPARLEWLRALGVSAEGVAALQAPLETTKRGP